MLFVFLGHSESWERSLFPFFKYIFLLMLLVCGDWRAFQRKIDFGMSEICQKRYKMMNKGIKSESIDEITRCFRQNDTQRKIQTCISSNPKNWTKCILGSGGHTSFQASYEKGNQIFSKCQSNLSFYCSLTISHTLVGNGSLLYTWSEH